MVHNTSNISTLQNGGNPAGSTDAETQMIQPNSVKAANATQLMTMLLADPQVRGTFSQFLHAVEQSQVSTPNGVITLMKMFLGPPQR